MQAKEGNMATFPESVKGTVRKRSGGRCECERLRHPHRGRCAKRGTQFHHVTQGGPDTASNCQHLCAACHEATRSYGRPK